MNSLKTFDIPNNPTANTLAARQEQWPISNGIPSAQLGNSISNYFAMQNSQFEGEEETVTQNNQDVIGSLTPQAAEVTSDLAEVGTGPLLAANAVTAGLVHANNQERDVEAQNSPNFDAQHIAQLQDARDETVAQVGMGATTALTATLGLPGFIAGAAGTGIAESMDTVNQNQTLGTSGMMTTAAQGV